MTVNGQPDEGINTTSNAAPAARGRLRQLPAVLLNFSRKRVVTAVVVAVTAAAFLLVATGMTAGTATDWAGYGFVAAGSVLAGFLAGSYVGAPIGAVATFCDLRWPVVGLFGVIWASSPREAQPPAQLAVGILALAVMAWALGGRLELERRAMLAPGPEDADTELCTDCRPIFPVKPQPRS